MKKFTVIISVLLIGIICISLIFLMMGFRINITESIPIGLYRITGTNNLKNNFVIFCPDNRFAFKQGLERNYINPGLCPGGYGYLMKKVVAVKGDVMSVTDEGVYVNGKFFPYSKPKSHDGMGHALPQWHVTDYRLKEDEVLTMTSLSEWSFDGRYYGLVHVRQIKGVVLDVLMYKAI